MAEATTAAAPLDTKALGESLAAALAPALTTAMTTAITTAVSEANKPLVEQFKTLQAQPATAAGTPAAAGKPGEVKPVTLDDVKNVIAEQFKGIQQQNQQSAQRDAYLANKLKDVPAAYRNQLGNDPAKWATEEQTIRDQFKTDLAAAGLKPKDVGGVTPAGGAPPTSSVDLSKLNPTQLAELSFKQTAAGKPEATEAATTAAAK
jgi:hypothetical protein